MHYAPVHLPRLQLVSRELLWLEGCLLLVLVELRQKARELEEVESAMMEGLDAQAAGQVGGVCRWWTVGGALPRSP